MMAETLGFRTVEPMAALKAEPTVVLMAVKWAARTAAYSAGR